MSKRQTTQLLFVCTHNSVRSILAEGLTNHFGKGQWQAISAGAQPRDTVHPQALAVLREYGCPTEGHTASPGAFSILGVPDPSLVQTSPEAQKDAFRGFAERLLRRLTRLAELPLGKLAASTLTMAPRGPLDKPL